MQIGAVFPQLEIGAGPQGPRAYALAAEAMGYTHLLAYDHVVGADITNRPDWRGPYSLDSLFHEPLVLFGYLAAITQSLAFVTGIIILPQRQTVLVAKQATEVDVLSEGRFRLGVGIGWNEVEYAALNETFSNRGRRSEEQIEVLRALFTQKSVSFKGRWHHIEDAGLKPLPTHGSIPIWIGGSSDLTLRRVAKMGDGWFPQGSPVATAREMMETLRRYVDREGRDMSTVGIEARVSVAGKTSAQWREEAEEWSALGATHLGVNTMGAGLDSVQAHIDALGRFKEATAGL